MCSTLKYQLITLCCVFLMAGLSLPAAGQTIDFSSPVSMHYDGKHLDDVLDDLSARYGVGFSYSRQIIPVHQRIYLHADDVPFGQALESLFAQTQVIFGVIGNQLVLSVDMQKVPVHPDLGYNKSKRDDSLVAASQTPRMYYEITPLSWQSPVLQYTSSRIAYEEVAYDLKTQQQHAEIKTAAVRAQVTFVPPLSVDSDPRGEEPVNFSLNVLGGATSSVRGVEFGGLVNVTSDEMKGFQAAGLANVVGDRVDGFQAAGLLNVVGHESRGMQAAGLINVAGEGIHGQASGLANIAKGIVRGQAAGLFNVARDINGAQVSGLFNVARNVRGVQIGLFNFADSTSAIPIGIISVARRGGYHSLELAVEDAIDYNLNVRLGVRSFYNILHVGLDQEGENWSLGYGIGTSFWLAARNYLQFEIMSRQINEGEPWTSELNLLTQFKMSYDFALGKNLRFAVGPSFNVSTSRRYDEEMGLYGSDVPRYTMFDHTYDDGFRTPINVKYWVGLQAGIRFGSAETLPYRRRLN